VEIYTTGFSGWIAEDFFKQLKNSNIEILIDIRRHPNSQLAGFTRAAHFKYFLTKLVGSEYIHMLEFAPNPNTLKSYRNKEIDWENFSNTYIRNLKNEDLAHLLDLSIKKKVILLCSETQPNYCHRSLVVQELIKIKKDLQIEVKNLTPSV